MSARAAGERRRQERQMSARVGIIHLTCHNSRDSGHRFALQRLKHILNADIRVAVTALANTTVVINSHTHTHRSDGVHILAEQDGL